MEFQLPQYLWLIAKQNKTNNNAYILTIKTDGITKDFTITSINFETLRNNTNNADKSVNTSPKLREYRMLNDKVAYLKPGPFYNAENPSKTWNNTNFVTFIDEAFESFIENKADKLIIDVRNNPGGTNSFSDALIAWFADKPFRFASEFLVRSSAHAQSSNQARLKVETSEVGKQFDEKYNRHPYGSIFSFPIEDAKPREGKQFEGEIFVLVNRSSYSNAVSLAAIVKDYGFGTIIGEQTTDFATTLASMETFTLIESGLTVGFPKARIIRPSGDKTPGPIQPDLVVNIQNAEDILLLPVMK